MKSFMIIILGMVSAVALGQDPAPVADVPPWYVTALAPLLGAFPEINGWFVAVALALMSFLRGLAEALAFIAAKTPSTKDDELAAKAKSALAMLAKIVGWFGVGSPKL